jgi:hypothetical protein
MHVASWHARHDVRSSLAAAPQHPVSSHLARHAVFITPSQHCSTWLPHDLLYTPALQPCNTPTPPPPHPATHPPCPTLPCPSQGPVLQPCSSAPAPPRSPVPAGPLLPAPHQRGQRAQHHPGDTPQAGAADVTAILIARYVQRQQMAQLSWPQGLCGVSWPQESAQPSPGQRSSSGGGGGRQASIEAAGRQGC